MINTCSQLAKRAWHEKGYKRRQIIIKNIGKDTWRIRTPNSDVELSGHCRWCAVKEAIEKEVVK